MNQQQQAAALAVAREVRNQTKTRHEGARELHQTVGINLRSAELVIDFYLHLCEGKAITFHASQSDLAFFMASFEEAGQLEDFASALKALKLYIQHWEGNGQYQGRSREILMDSEAVFQKMMAERLRPESPNGQYDLHAIAKDLNLHAKDYQIGKLHHIRKRLKGGQRLARSKSIIFDKETIHREGNWAFHYGGRGELQFNIGVEHFESKRCLRFGVAFSLEPSQTLPDVTQLYPKIKRFNEYMALYPGAFPDFFQWCWSKGRSPLYTDNQIRQEFVSPGQFIFFGRYIPWEDYSPSEVLRSFDRLLPLFEYVEGPEGTEPLELPGADRFEFTPNEFDRVESTQYSREQRVIDVNLRHMVIQRALFDRLREQYGADNVCCERSSGVGVRVDLIVRSGTEYWFYEVKTGGTARSCIREALGQLLEYAFWPGAQRATRLIVVGEPPLDSQADEYLKMLREQFDLPLEYEQQLSLTSRLSTAHP
jgi:hypothetical protein